MIETKEPVITPTPVTPEPVVVKKLRLGPIRDRPFCLQHMKILWHPIVDLLPTDQRDLLKSSLLLQPSNTQLQQGLEEVIAQLVYLYDLLPEFQKNAKKDNCFVDLVCYGDFDNYGRDCLRKQNKFNKRQNDLFELLTKIVAKDNRTEEQLTEANY